MFLTGFGNIQKILMTCYLIIICFNVQILFGMDQNQLSFSLQGIISERKKLERFWAQENINDDIKYTTKQGVPVGINFSLQKELPRHIIDMCAFVKYSNQRFVLTFKTLQELENNEKKLSTDIKIILESNSASNVNSNAKSMQKLSIAKILQYLFTTRAVVASSVVYEDIETYSELDKIKSKKLRSFLFKEQEKQKKVNDESKSEIDKLKKTIQRLETEKENLDLLTKEQGGNIKKYRQELEQRIQEFNNANKTIKESNKAIGSLKNKHEVEKNNSEKQFEEKIKEVADLQYKIKTLTAEKEQLDKAKKVVDQQMLDLQDVLKDKNQSLDIAKNQLKEVQNKLKKYETYIIFTYYMIKADLPRYYKHNDFIAQTYTKRWSNTKCFSVSAVSLCALLFLMHIAATYSNSIVSFEKLLVDNFYKSFDYFYISALANWYSLQEIIKGRSN